MGYPTCKNILLFSGYPPKESKFVNSYYFCRGDPVLPTTFVLFCWGAPHLLFLVGARPIILFFLGARPNVLFFLGARPIILFFLGARHICTIFPGCTSQLYYFSRGTSQYHCIFLRKTNIYEVKLLRDLRKTNLSEGSLLENL